MAVPGEIIPIVALLTGGFIAVGVPLARAYAKRIERGPSSQAAVPTDVTARLERMEQALDSIAIEVERISEGQRFTTKLLADRTGSTSAGATGRQE